MTLTLTSEQCVQYLFRKKTCSTDANDGHFFLIHGSILATFPYYVSTILEWFLVDHMTRSKVSIMTTTRSIMTTNREHNGVVFEHTRIAFLSIMCQALCIRTPHCTRNSCFVN